MESPLGNTRVLNMCINVVLQGCGLELGCAGQAEAEHGRDWRVQTERLRGNVALAKDPRCKLHRELPQSYDLLAPAEPTMRRMIGKDGSCTLGAEQ
jgi:hypothetical protein